MNLLHCYFSAPSSTKKRRFQLGAYQRIKKEQKNLNSKELNVYLSKKLENDETINHIKQELDEQEAELQRLSKQLHNTQARISKRKRKVNIEFTVTLVSSYVLLAGHPCNSVFTAICVQ
jgi:ribosome-associated translation inhibitor RaiA